MLGDDAAEFVAGVDDPRQVGENEACVGVRNDDQLVHRREQTPIDGVFAMQALWVLLVREFLQLVPYAVSRLLKGASQEVDVIGRDVEGDGNAVPRRVLVSHEELCLLVVRPSAGVTAPAGGRFVEWLPRVAASSRESRQT